MQLKVLQSLLKIIDIKNKNKRRWWRRPINLHRKDIGYFATTFQELKQDPYMFFRITRMDLNLFNNLHQNLYTHLFLKKLTFWFGEIIKYLKTDICFRKSI